MRLESLTPDAVVDGVVPGTPVTVLRLQWHGSDALTLTYRLPSGAPAEQTLFRTDEPRLAARAAATTWTFDADPAEFRLAAEASRIRTAATFEEMLAVTASDITPLPHQIRAVYAEMLPTTGALRFLLADDPGAGKTIMAGLLIKELHLRGDLARCLVVAPGGLVEQWQDELAAKFGLTFRILTPGLAAEARDGNPFPDNPLLIARMDQLTRNEHLRGLLAGTEWDLVVVDEAHRMSAHFYGGEVQRTRRYELGETLGTRTRHLLLMTATPHAGKEEDFQLLLALLDPDRFEGRFRPGAHTGSTSGLMCRTVKEGLLTFVGKPLFPERIAETVPYHLTPGEAGLYEAVTAYVRSEFGRADALRAAGEGRRSTTVGFALTVLQRRLASSPEAIYQSLTRRTARLQQRRDLMAAGSPLEAGFAGAVDDGAASRAATLAWDDDERDAEETETLEEEVLDAATTARTIAELDAEITTLRALAEHAARVRAQPEHAKWAALRSLLLAKDETPAPIPRKVIVFTEHRDTLTYLTHRVGTLLGDAGAVVVIHGGTPRHERAHVRELFAKDPRCQVLLATDAAGEGLNLQCAHLMVNYDLPWNPNRIEQRFGRIHRIGQREVCRLWNLVAVDTREGQVFARLLGKIEEQRRAYAGRVFDVLGGAAFADRPLRDLLIRAIRYGDLPETRAYLDQVIDASVADGMSEMMRERALAGPALADADLAALRRQMDQARARRLQPHFIELFVRQALPALGGRIAPREAGRFEITHLPAAIRGHTLASRYARVTFDPARIEVDGAPRADLLAPGHPVLDAIVAATLDRYGPALRRGATFLDPRDPGATPRLAVTLTSEITDGHDRTVSRAADTALLAPDPAGHATPTAGGPAPYLDVEPLPDDAAPTRAHVLTQAWLGPGVETLATTWAVTHALPTHRTAVEARLLPQIEHVRREVAHRLHQQANYWWAQAARLREDQAAGRRVRLSPATAQQRGDALDARRAARLADLDAAAHLNLRPPVIQSAALILPAGLLPAGGGTVEAAPSSAIDTTASERRAVDAVLAAERALGRAPIEQPHNNPGFDILSLAPDGHALHIEVKGRIAGAGDVTVTLTEVLTGKNTAPRYRLALVRLDPDDGARDEVRYHDTPFTGIDLGTYGAAVTLNWRTLWAAGRPPF